MEMMILCDVVLIAIWSVVQFGIRNESPLKTVAEGVNRLRSEDRGMIVVTHYQRLLDYIVPDKVHVLADGKLAATGGADLALKLEEQGYAWLEDGGIATLDVQAAGQRPNP